MAWLVGIISFLAICAVLVAALDTVGVSYSFDGPPHTARYGRVDVEQSGGSLAVFLCPLIAAAAMVAFRIGAVVWSGHLDADLSSSEQISFTAWLSGLVAFGALDLAVEMLFQSAFRDDAVPAVVDLARLAIHLALAAGMFTIFSAWRRRRLAHLEPQIKRKGAPISGRTRPVRKT